MNGEVTFRDKGALKEIAKIVEGRLVEFGETVVEMARDNAPVDTGNLKRSIEAKQVSDKSMTIQTRTGYGAYVELGTKRMEARPYLAPAVKQALKELEKSGPWA